MESKGNTNWRNRQGNQRDCDSTPPSRKSSREEGRESWTVFLVRDQGRSGGHRGSGSHGSLGCAGEQREGTIMPRGPEALAADAMTVMRRLELQVTRGQPTSITATAYPTLFPKKNLWGEQGLAAWEALGPDAQEAQSSGEVLEG